MSTHDKVVLMGFLLVVGTPILIYGAVAAISVFDWVARWR